MNTWMNSGEQYWEQLRYEWKRNKSSNVQSSIKKRSSNKIDPSIIYTDIVSKDQLSGPVPLKVFLKVLVDVWAKEGIQEL